MVNYVPKIMKVMHQFKPEGQRLLLKTLRQNRGVINKRYGFAKELPSILIKNGVVGKLDRTCMNESGICGILDDLLVDGLKINTESKFWGKTCERFRRELNKVMNRPKTMIDELGIEFERKRLEICNFLKTHGLTKMAKKAKNAQNPEQLAVIAMESSEKYNDNHTMVMVNLLIKDRIRDFSSLDELSSRELSEFGKRVVKFTQRRQKNPAIGYSLEALQVANKEEGKVGDFLLGLQKIISPKSTNPEIIKIEDILRKRYGMDYVHFTTLEDAKIFLESAKIARREGVPMAKNVSTSNILWNGTAGVNCHDACGHNLILLRPKSESKWMLTEINKLKASIGNKKYKKYTYLSDEINAQFGYSQQNLYSTASELHVPMHEIIHSEAIGKRFNPQLIKPISDIQKEVAEKVSAYSAMSMNGVTEEVRTELRTKEILSKYQPRFAEKLTADEVKLLDYLS